MRRITVSMRRAGGLAAIALLALTVQAQTPDGDWTTYNRTYSGERYSPIKEINTSNVSKLRTICTYDTGESVAFQTGPLVLNGVMYFTTVKTTYAIDAATCALKWKHEHPFEGLQDLAQIEDWATSMDDSSAELTMDMSLLSMPHPGKPFGT